MKVQTFLKAILLSTTLFFAINSFAQNVGIGTTTPVAGLHVADSSVLFSAPATLPVTAGLPPVSGVGNRMMWYSRKAAFRAGGTANTSWNETYIGNYSTAFGLSNKAAGLYATSTGWGNSSSGIASFSTGFSNTSAGTYSAAFGNNVDAPAYASLVLGRYNVVAGNSASWVDTDPLFVVGNGYTYEVSPGIGAIQRRNAFSIDKTGNTIVNGKMNIAGEVNVAKDAIIDSSTYIGKNLEVTGATTLTGLLKLSQKYVPLNTCGPFTLTVGNTSYIKLASAGCNVLLTPSVTLSDGLELGQILIIVASNGSIFFKDAQSNNMALTSDHTLRTGSTITLLWTGGIWTQLAVSDIN